MTGSASATPGEWKAYIESDNRFDDNSWHFVVSMYVPNDKVYFYIDNILVASTTFLTNYPSDNLLYIGRHIDDNGANPAHESHFNGTIDDIRIYDRELTSYEIQLLYQDGGWR